MSTIPTNVARVPNMLASSIMLNALGRTSSQLLKTQVQLSSGKALNRPSDNAIGAATVAKLNDNLERREQTLRNLSHAESVLINLDQALNDGTDIIREAKTVGLSQIGIGSDELTRKNQAKLIDAMLNEMFSVGNRQLQDIFLFGGDRTAVDPFSNLLGGIVYNGVGDGMTTDLGVINPFPITLGGEEAFGSLSSRVEGDYDLNPEMVADTRIVDLYGAQGLGVRLGTININVNGTDYELDLSSADTVSDITTMLEDFINTNEPGALDVGGVTIDSTTGNRFNIDVAVGFTITISDLSASSNTATDLGLSQTAFQDGVNETGADVDPKLTDLTPISSLPGVTYPMGTIRISNAGQTRDLDLSGVTSIQELKIAVAGLDIGVRVEIADTEDRLNFINELSGGSMAIAEVAGGLTATELGVRSFATTTSLKDFNDGRGVDIVSGSVDPITGILDPTRDLDFRVTVKDGTTFDVDLTGAITVQDVLDMINTEAAAAGLAVPADFEAALAADGNGIEFTDNTVGVTTSVIALNNSYSAEQLGILKSTTSAALTGDDRATVAVESVFSHLIALRDALQTNDELGIQIATAKFDDDLDRLISARGDVGVRGQRVGRLTSREEELRIQDESLRSVVQDLDFADAAIKFANLQTQLQAGLTTTSQSLSLSLIDFLR